VLVFDTGEEVSAGLLRFAKQQKLEGAHLTAIGALERVTLGFLESAKKAYTKIPVEEQVELLSLVGNIARDDQGEPKLHAHAVVGKGDGTAHGGHLRDARVRPTLEVVVIESPPGVASPDAVRIWCRFARFGLAVRWGSNV
jgi:predicted DNA-binding protein with PD1-like motif